jgi:hypothetical protein
MMFRLPVLAGAAGALGATYCSPYISVDGAYHARPSGKTSSLGSSRLVANCHCAIFLNVLLNSSSGPLIHVCNFSIKNSAKQYHYCRSYT